MKKPMLVFSLFVALSLQASAQSAAEWVVKGRALLDSGKNDAAAKAFEKAVKLEDGSSANHMWLAQALGNVARKSNVIKQGMMAGRIKKEMERARELDPRSMDPHQGLMEFYLEAPGFMGGSLEKARIEAVEIAKINKLRGHFAEVEIALNQKDSARAEHEYRLAANEFPDSAVAYATLAFYLVNTKRNTEAFAVIDKTLARKPEPPMGLFYLGRLSVATGMSLDRGEAALRKYIAIPPDTADQTRALPASAHFRLGEVLVKRGNNAEARKEFEMALALNPKLDAARNALKNLK